MSEARGFLGAGDVYINPIVNGIFTGWEGPFEADKYEIKANGDLKEKTSKGRYTYGQVLESVDVPKAYDLNITLTELGKAGMALALRSVASDVAQTAGTMTDAAIEVFHDKWVELPRRALSGALTFKTSGDVALPLVEGTDYIINRDMGMLKALPDGDLTDGQDIKVSAAYLGYAGSKITGGTAQSVRAAFRLDGVNFADQSTCTVDTWEAVVSSDAAVDFLSDNFGEVPLKGRMKTPVGKPGPFEIVQRQPA